MSEYINLKSFKCCVCKKEVNFIYTKGCCNGGVECINNYNKLILPGYTLRTSSVRYCIDCFKNTHYELLNGCLYNNSTKLYCECGKCKEKINRLDQYYNIKHFYPDLNNQIKLEEYDFCKNCYKKYIGETFLL